MNNYDLPKLRRALIGILATNLNKNSKFYKEDYDNICAAVNKKSRAELIVSYNNAVAIAGVSDAEIARNCQFK